jgi:peroxiredoxin Q/BCP
MAKKKTRKAARKAAKTSSAKKAKKAAAKKTAKKTLKKGATKSVKRTVKKPSKKAPAPRLKKTAPAKPRMPRRTPQAAPPPAPPAPAPAALAPPAVVLNEGQRAPDFNLADDQGGMHTLSGYRGRTVVLYFYPKDDTPGCTTEACGFRDTLGQFSDRGAVVLGVSPDDVSSHQKFIAKYGLTFPLLADEDHSVAERYGVWVEKSMYGKTYWGIARTTFVIAPDGTIRKIFRGVRPEGHEAEVLAALG